MPSPSKLNEYNHAEEPAHVNCWNDSAGHTCPAKCWRRSAATSGTCS